MTIIGLLGGTFDPPHLGHLAVARIALWTGDIDAVWMLPCWEHAFGKKPKDFHHRASMCQQMVEEEKDVLVCTDEAEIKSKCAMDILTYIIKKNPDKEFRLILGTDNYWKMDQWEDRPGVYKLARPLWVERSGESRIPERVCFLSNDISSTKARQALTDGEPVNEMLHDKVIKYIVQNKVY